jgi:hypothetical protein
MIRLTIIHANATGPIEFPSLRQALEIPGDKMTNEDAKKRVDEWLTRNNRRLVSWDKEVLKDAPAKSE